jgi:dihydropyrimidinase
VATDEPARAPPSTVETVLAGGTIATHEGTFEGSLAIDDGTIVAVGDETALPAADTRVDVSDRIVMPGVVDPHVHVDETDVQVGTYESETCAAALGGVTTVLDFAWQDGLYVEELGEGATLADCIDRKRERGERGYVDFGFHGTLSREDEGSLDEVSAALDRGVTSFKLFLAEYEGTGVSRGFVDQVFERLAATGGVAVVHAEDPTTCERRTSRARSNGVDDPARFGETRPDYAEAMAVDSVARLATRWGVQYYNVHTTSRAAVEALASHQTDGSLIRGETCPHYLVLDESAFDRQGTLPLLTPPLRTPEDVAAMVEALQSGVIWTVGTDHCVYSRASKQVPWWDCPRGINGLQHALPLVHDAVVATGELSLPELVRVACTTPARTFGMPWKGTLEPGTDADVVVFDPAAEYTITAADNASNADYSVYEGRTVRGRVAQTFVRGELVAADGEPVADPGHGQFVERDVPDWSRRV